jgi:hypothetical protein
LVTSMADLFRGSSDVRTDADPVVLTPDERMHKLKSVIGAAIARKLHTEPESLDRIPSGLRLKPFETEWAMSQQTSFFSLGRLVQIALALGCDISISAR